MIFFYDLHLRFSSSFLFFITLISHLHIIIQKHPFFICSHYFHSLSKIFRVKMYNVKILCFPPFFSNIRFKDEFFWVYSILDKLFFDYLSSFDFNKMISVCVWYNLQVKLFYDLFFLVFFLIKDYPFLYHNFCFWIRNLSK